MSTFVDKLDAAVEANQSLLCIGLDPDPARMPIRDVAEFTRHVVEATSDLVCAYKPNLAFYEALGVEGMKILESTLGDIPSRIVTIGDGKRGDIGSTAEAYARSMFENFGFDAITVNPYLGHDSMMPFFEYEEKGIFVVCRTSNPGGRDFQDLPVLVGDSQSPLYQWVAFKAQEWDVAGNVGLVVGATQPAELSQVRAMCPGMPILIPGVGAQGADLGEAVARGADTRGRRAIINASRSILYASPDSLRFPNAAREEAVNMRQAIGDVLETMGAGWGELRHKE